MQDIQKAAPAINAFLRDRTLLTMLRLFLPSLPLHSQLIKLQCNIGQRKWPAAHCTPLSCLPDGVAMRLEGADSPASDATRPRRLLSDAL